MLYRQLLWIIGVIHFLFFPNSSLQSVWCGASTVRGKFDAFSHSIQNMPTCIWGAGVLQHKHSQHVKLLASWKSVCEWLVSAVLWMSRGCVWRWWEILQPLLTGFVQHEISRYYVYILFSRCERTASFNPPSAAHWGKTESLRLPTSLDSLCLTLYSALCFLVASPCKRH